MSESITIATRKSPLALWQAYYVKSALEQAHPELKVELLEMQTQGDKILDTPLAKIGGKGLFVKELETALLDGRADIAVHSMKDVPMDFPEGLGLSVICEREDPRDAFVSNHYTNLETLPEGAKLGTSSLRRQAQIRALRPDLEIIDLRGNVGTRLAKLDAGNYDAIILAAAGLIRLELGDRIQAFINHDKCLPACGQGAVGIECRLDDQATQEKLLPLKHEETQIRVTAERAMNHGLQGGCQVPIGGFAVLTEPDQLKLEGLVASVDGREVIKRDISGPASKAEALGKQLANELLSAGAREILQALQSEG